MKLFSQKEISYIKLLKEAEQVALDAVKLDKEKSLITPEEREKLIKKMSAKLEQYESTKVTSKIPQLDLGVVYVMQADSNEQLEIDEEDQKDSTTHQKNKQTKLPGSA